MWSWYLAIRPDVVPVLPDVAFVPSDTCRVLGHWLGCGARFAPYSPMQGLFCTMCGSFVAILPDVPFVLSDVVLVVGHTAGCVACFERCGAGSWPYCRMWRLFQAIPAVFWAILPDVQFVLGDVVLVAGHSAGCVACSVQCAARLWPFCRM
jgi:uncharacterized membrane protein